MNNALLGALLSFILCLPFLQVKAQVFSTQGKDFWLGFMENYEYAAFGYIPELRVYISSRVATSGTVSVPRNGWSQSFTVAANATTAVIVPKTTAMATGSETILDMGVHVTTSDTVSVFVINYVRASSDATVVLPSSSLGREYYVMAYDYLSIGFGSNYPSEFMIVSIEDSTQVEITPSAVTVGGRPPGVPFTVMLNAGEAYQVQINGDATGSKITSIGGNATCKKFAVFAGAVCTNVGGCQWCDHLYEQMLPTKYWGREFITVPYMTRLGDIVRVMASQNGTDLYINGGYVTTLNTGQYYESLNINPTYISSSLPVTVAQYSRGAACDLVTDSDPFHIIISPLEQDIRNVVFTAFPSSTFPFSYYMNVVTKTSNTGLAQLDGTGISGFFNPVSGNPAYSYAQMNISQANHILSSDSGLVAYVYGYGSYESYGYMAGSAMIDLSLWYYLFVNGQQSDTTWYYDNTNNICQYDIVDFYASTDSTIVNHTWIFGDGSTGTGQNITHAFDSAGDFNVLLIVERSLGTCLQPEYDTISHRISVKPQPLISFSADTFYGCPPLLVNLLNSTVTDSLASYLWDFGDGSTDTSLSPVHAWQNSGTYDVTLTVISGDSCVNTYTDTAMILVLDQPVAGFTTNPDTGIVDQPVAFQDQSSNATSWYWNFGDGDTSTLRNPSHAFTDMGNFDVLLVVLSADSCVDSVRKTIFITFEFTYYLPNVFTPNGDNVNDVFAGTGNVLFVQDFTMEVWNRWGEMVFQTTDKAAGWKGSKNNEGAVLQDGVYIYVVRITGGKGDEYTYKGPVLLIK